MKRLGETVHDAMQNVSRRLAYLSCAALYEKSNIQRRGPVTVGNVIRSEGTRHVLGGAICYPRLEIDVGAEVIGRRSVVATALTTMHEALEMEVNVCKWCGNLWQEAMGDKNHVPACPTLNIVPFSDIPHCIQSLSDLESTALSCIGMRAKILFGTGRGNVHDAVCGDFKYGEDVNEGREGLLCGDVEWTEEIICRVAGALRMLLSAKVANPYVRNYLTAAELMQPGDKGSTGEPLISPDAVHAFHVDGAAGYGEVGGVYRTRLTRLWKTRKVINTAVAGQCTRRSDGASSVHVPEEVTFDMDVEGRAFPCLYIDGNGSWDSRDWALECGVSEMEWLEKRIWSINPQFRRNRVWLFAQYDRRQKDALYAMPNFIALSDDVEEEEAEGAACALRRARVGCHDTGIEELRRGVRGVAAAADELGDPNLFVTITMSEGDMPWLLSAMAQVETSNIRKERRVSFEPPLCAYYFSALVKVLVEKVFGDAETFGGLVFYAFRLENQSYRSNKLHAHCILRVEASDIEICEALTADLSDLCAAFRMEYEARARHECQQKCAAGKKVTDRVSHMEHEEPRSPLVPEYECKYGYPCNIYSTDTMIVTRNGRRETIYRRRIGMERVVSYFPVVKGIYPAHGADRIMTSAVMAAYTGKWRYIPHCVPGRFCHLM